MPVNRNTLVRYKVIDRMLRHGRQATLEELIFACSDALMQNDKSGQVSRRTVQHDIEEMRHSRELGYHAPIVVVDRKYYKYEDPSYSITQMPLSSDDMLQLSEAVDLLKQMSAFKGFDGVEDVVNRLEDYVASKCYKVEPVILLESNERLRGLQYMTDLHDAIIDRMPLLITYKPFVLPEAETFCFSPYILKEFRNRWFVFGKRHDVTELSVCVLALDRIEDISKPPKGTEYLFDFDFNPAQYFKDIVGVTRYAELPIEHVVFRALEAQAPYVRTKPIHQSQKEMETLADGSVLFSIDVIPNYELERDLLGYGESLTVLSPDSLVKKLRERMEKSLENYRNQEKK